MKTGKKCLICTSPDCDQINAKLIAGLSIRKIAEEYDISKSAVARHRSNHLPATLVKAKQMSEVDSATKLVEQIEGLYLRAYQIIDKAEAKEKFSGAVAAIREARGSLELLAKISGDLKSGTHLTLIYSPQWISLRQVLVKALEPYPEVKAKVIDALEVHELDETIDG